MNTSIHRHTSCCHLSTVRSSEEENGADTAVVEDASADTADAADTGGADEGISGMELRAAR